MKKVVTTLGQLAAYVGAELHSINETDSEIFIEQVATLDDAQEGNIAFLFDRKYRKFLQVTHASAVILQERYVEDCPVPSIVCNDPYLAYAKIASFLNQAKPIVNTIHASAVVDKDAKVDSTAEVSANVVIEKNAVIGADVYIGPGCVIAEGSKIDDYSHLVSNVTICHDVSVGKRCIIHPGAVIGSDGFGLARDNGAWVKIPQIGSVQIGDDVEVGANTTIDRGALKDTIIENGVKLDNQVQVAHNVRIGENTALAGCVGVAGSATIGKRCMLGGGVGIAGHLEIADDVTITGMSLVTKSINEAGGYSSGWPVREARDWRRTVAKVHRLDNKNNKD